MSDIAENHWIGRNKCGTLEGLQKEEEGGGRKGGRKKEEEEGSRKRKHAE